MELLTSIDQLKGKVIRDVRDLDFYTSLSFVFEDDTYIIVTAHNNYDADEIGLNEVVDAYVEFRAGVISEEEYKEKCAKQEEERARWIEESELCRLAELKKKYEGGISMDAKLCDLCGAIIEGAPDGPIATGITGIIELNQDIGDVCAKCIKKALFESQQRKKTPKGEKHGKEK